MLIGYARVSKADGSQVLDLQRDALTRAGVSRKRIYEAALDDESRMHRESFAQPGIRERIRQEFG